MTDKNLLERMSRLVKVVPIDNGNIKDDSWSENSKKLLSTEKKIYAIKISEQRNQINSSFPLNGNRVERHRKYSIVKKWLSKCKWKLPKTMIIFSFMQVRIYSEILKFKTIKVIQFFCVQERLNLFFRALF